MPRSWAHLPRRFFLVAMLAGSGFITASSLAYFDFDVVPPFVIERLPERFPTLWLASLRVHVAAALITLPLCLLLMTRWLQRRPAWHRWLGRVSGVLVLLGLVPSGAVLALHAKGGPPVTAGFLISAGILTWFMLGGVLAARRGRLATHRRAMAHVVAQMSVAVTSRALLLALDAGGVDPDLAYVVALWGPVLASAAVVEVLAVRANGPRPSFVPLVERIRRALLPQDRPLAARPVPRPVTRPGR